MLRVHLQIIYEVFFVRDNEKDRVKIWDYNQLIFGDKVSIYLNKYFEKAW